MQCPGCGAAELAEAGYTQRCPACDGAWIDEQVLVGILQKRTSSLVDLPWQPREQDRERACPSCQQAMQPVKLGTVALDRCATHGVWFDARELAELLAQAKQFKHEPKPGEHQGLLRSIAKLFGG
jgi:Zn-finger nucleic acid-binding protein